MDTNPAAEPGLTIAYPSTKATAGALLDGVAWRQTPVWPDVR